ncbi:MAG TPA: imidazole glycerol phosphate synthase subunit HisH [Acidimicrobiia bacterium]
MQRIAVVDTGLCNVDSMWRAVDDCGAKAVVTDDPTDLALVDKIVLPGVGAFADAMDALDDSGMAEAIVENVRGQEVPILGVCIGMQLLANTGSEVRHADGLGLIDAAVTRLVPAGADCTTSARERIPHVGWNEVHPRVTSPLLAGIPDATDFYFVHSFHMQCVDERDVVATTPYCGEFVAIVARGHVFGTQFHPEKSQAMGRRLLRNFVDL